MIAAVGQVASTLNDREVGNLLHSLSKLAVPWSVFPKPVQHDLLESFIRVSKLLVSQQGSMAVYSLGLMGLTLDNVTPAVRDHVFVVALSVLEESKVHVHPSVTQQVPHTPPRDPHGPLSNPHTILTHEGVHIASNYSHS